MARSWAQLLGDSDEPEETVDEQRGFFGRLRESLAKSRRALTEQIQVAAFDPSDRPGINAADPELSSDFTCFKSGGKIA